MRSSNSPRMPLTPWRDSIHRRVSSALTRMPNPLRPVTWQSADFVGEAYAAGFLRQTGGVHYLTGKGVALWFEVNPKPDPDADRRRDLVAYDEVLREFGFSSKTTYRSNVAALEGELATLAAMRAERDGVTP